MQRRPAGELQADEVLGASFVLVRPDAPEEADALRGMDQGVALGHLAEVEGAADLGPHGGAAAGQGGERPPTPAEEFALGEQDESPVQRPGQRAGRNQHARAEAGLGDDR